MPDLRDLAANVELFTFQRAKSLQQYCGDMYYYLEKDHQFLCVLADGLGSGHEAHKSALAAIEVIRSAPEEDLLTMMNSANQAVASLRGAAIAIIRADLEKARITYSGMGNIRFFLIGQDGKLVYPLSTTGYLSGRRQRFSIKNFHYKPGTKFLMHSDGLVLDHVKSYLESPLCVVKTGHQIEQTIQAIPSDDVTFLLGKFPNI
ncbi:PP2C family serine/threonine-protein phosphatase [Listeria costaricensis]|uniref:PP2C family serine/threonine-protein phosphatase n=1 Tax=Listeria costaricensis TaxID=2026604 RepID=UPI000C08B708|nr:PP2C family serine/threonine-protein phosphatase [Listeria costaricensis]